MIKAIYVKPFEQPKVIGIDGSLESYQKLVGGFIEVVYPFNDEVAIVCNENGKFDSDCIPNRPLYKDEIMYDVIHGPFLIVGIGKDDFASIPEELINHYIDMFSF